jgi:hypothetical protein
LEANQTRRTREFVPRDNVLLHIEEKALTLHNIVRECEILAGESWVAQYHTNVSPISLIGTIVPIRSPAETATATVIQNVPSWAVLRSNWVTTAEDGVAFDVEVQQIRSFATVDL